jgi:hypothetical protein
MVTQTICIASPPLYTTVALCCHLCIVTLISLHVHTTSTNWCPRTSTLYRYPLYIVSPVYSLTIVILLLPFNYLLPFICYSYLYFSETALWALRLYLAHVTNIWFDHISIRCGNSLNGFPIKITWNWFAGVFSLSNTNKKNWRYQIKSLVAFINCHHYSGYICIVIRYSKHCSEEPECHEKTTSFDQSWK